MILGGRQILSDRLPKARNRVSKEVERFRREGGRGRRKYKVRGRRMEARESLISWRGN